MSNHFRLEPWSEQDPYHVSSSHEIRHLFKRILDEGILMRMQAKDTDAAVVTTLLAFDTGSHQLIIDNAAHQHINDALLAATVVLFETRVDNVKVQFVSDTLQSATYDAKAAFAIPMPEAIRRLQRRDAFRVRVPMNQPATCSISDQNQNALLTIHDISVAGVALVDSQAHVSLTVGMVLRNCVLRLDDRQTLNTDLQIVRVQTEKLENGREVIKIGAAFINLSGSTEIHIQNYCTRLERSLIAKDRGLN